MCIYVLYVYINLDLIIYLYCLYIIYMLLSYFNTDTLSEAQGAS